MSFSKYPKLQKFFSSVIVDSDQEKDESTAQSYYEAASEDDRTKLQGELRTLLSQSELPVEDFGSEANRWFGGQEDAREWLTTMLASFDKASAAGDVVTVLDSNGTPLLEGDSVTVIKDLKVKGGSSDLKRGTLVKKIHLTSDPKMIECKVDGTVLVLKTEFLKKS